MHKKNHKAVAPKGPPSASAPLAPATPLAVANPAAAGVTFNPDQQLAQGVQNAQAGIANPARQGIVDVRGSIRDATFDRRAEVRDLNQQKRAAKQNFRQTGDRSQLESIAGAMAQAKGSYKAGAAQNKADLQLAKQTNRLATGRANKQAQYQPQAGTTYSPNAPMVSPTGQVLGMAGSNPGGQAAPLADWGDTVTQGHQQTLARQDGRTPGDFQTGSEYQEQANAFGLGRIGPSSNAIAPQLSYVDPKAKGFSPGEIINMQREADNLGQRDAIVREQRATDTLRGGQDSARGLYGQALGDSDQIGQQAYSRIDEQQTAANSGMQSNLMSRGLGNSTITQSLQGGIARQANDARLGVDQQRAQQRMGLRTALADSERNTAGSIAGAITGQGFRDRAATSAGDMGYVEQEEDYSQLIGPGIGALASLIPVVGPAVGGIAGAVGSGLFGKKRKGK